MDEDSTESKVDDLLNYVILLVERQREEVCCTILMQTCLKNIDICHHIVHRQNIKAFSIHVKTLNGPCGVVVNTTDHNAVSGTIPGEDVDSGIVISK